MWTVRAQEARTECRRRSVARAAMSCTCEVCAVLPSCPYFLNCGYVLIKVSNIRYKFQGIIWLLATAIV